jgi:hypothetical protein
MRKLLLVVIGVFMLSACSAKEAKPPSSDSTTAIEAFALADGIKEAYLKRDTKAIKEKTTANGYREMIGVMKKFDTAELAFTPRWVEIKPEGVYLNVSWSGKWTMRGEVTEERGMAVFLLEGSPMKLGRTIKGSPFGYPE